MMKKVKLSPDKKFLFGVCLKFGIFHILFCFVGFILAGAGHGTYVQFPIFYSWVFLPTIVDWPKEWVSDNIQIVFLFFVPVVFFIFSAIVLIALWFGKIAKDGLKIVVVGHFLIAFFIIVKFSVRYEFSFLDIKIQIFSTLVALSLSLSYWRTFFQVLNYKLVSAKHCSKIWA